MLNMKRSGENKGERFGKQVKQLIGEIPVLIINVIN